MSTISQRDSLFTGIAHLEEGPPTYRIAKSNFEKLYLESLLRWANGNVQRAAQRADRDRKGLYILMAKYGINPARYRNSRDR